MGKLALCHIAAFIDERHDGDEPIRSRMSQLGVTGSVLYNMLFEWCPEVFQDYYECTGKDLEGKTLMSRVGNMFRDNAQPGHWCVGPEHPSRHPALKELFEKICAEHKQADANAE